MGLASHAQPPSGGYVGDFGALFGFGTRGATRQDVEKGWKWEAPKSQLTESAEGGEQGSLLGYGWPGGKPKRKEDEHDGEAWEKFLQVPAEEDLVEDALANSSEINDAQDDPVLASSKDFGELLANLDRVEHLRTDDMAEVVTFLQSSADEDEAKTISRLLQWLGEREAVANNVMDVVMDVLVNKIRLGTLSSHECAHILKQFAFDLQPTSFGCNRMYAVLRALQDYENAKLTEVCTTTTRLLLEDVRSPNNELAPEIDSWLSCLHSFSKEGNQPSFNPVWQGVYDQLSQRYTRCAVLRKHLSVLDSESLAVILLRSWVPHVLDASIDPDLTLDGDESGGPSAITRLETGRRVTVPRGATAYGNYAKPLHRRPIDIRTSKLLRGASNIGYTTSGTDGKDDALHLSFSNLFPTHVTRISNSWMKWRSTSRQPEPPHSALVDLLVTLAFHRIPCTDLACDIFSILCYSPSPAGNNGVFVAYRRYRKQLAMGVPSVLGAQLVDHFMSTNSLRLALYVFRSVPGLALSRFQDLPIAIAEAGSKVHSTAVWDVLNRVAPGDYTPRPSLGKAVKQLFLSDPHIDLVHRVAFTFAQQEHLPPRVAFRRVWECYRFLKDRSAPVESLLSRALVTAGLIRPLKMGHRVSTEQLRYILSVVEVVEGKEVAEQLDRKVLEIWETSVLPALMKAKRLGTEEVGHVEKEQNRYKIVAWAKERKGQNRLVYPRQDDGTVGSETANKYQPFGFNGDAGDFSKSSHQATGAVEPDTANKYEPFAFNDDSGDFSKSSHQDTEAVEPDTANKYEPFALNDDASDISKSSPRAGADYSDVLASSEAQSMGSGSPAWLAELEGPQDTLWLNNESSGADIEPSLKPTPTLRHGLGYSTLPMKQQEASLTEKPLEELATNTMPFSPFGHISSEDVDLDSSISRDMAQKVDGNLDDTRETFGLKNESSGADIEPPSQPVSTTRRGLGYSTLPLKQHEPSLTIQQSEGVSTRTMPFNPFGHISSEEQSGEVSTSTVSFSPLEHISSEDVDLNTSISRGTAQKVDRSPQETRIPVSLSDQVSSSPGVDDPRNVVEMGNTTERVKEEPNQEAPSSTPPAKILVEYFPIFWQDEPRSFGEAGFLVRRFKKLHAEQVPTEAELAFMRSYDEALGRTLDAGQRVVGKSPATGFPFQWGNVMIDRFLGFEVKALVDSRARAAGRELDVREKAFVRELQRARKKFSNARNAAGSKDGRKGEDDSSPGTSADGGERPGEEGTWNAFVSE